MPNMKYDRLADADPQTPIPEPSSYSRSPRPTPADLPQPYGRRAQARSPTSRHAAQARQRWEPISSTEPMPTAMDGGYADLQQLQTEIAALRVDLERRAGAQEVARDVETGSEEPATLGEEQAADTVDQVGRHDLRGPSSAGAQERDAGIRVGLVPDLDSEPELSQQQQGAGAK